MRTKGTQQGMTGAGAPDYNVAMQLLLMGGADALPVRRIEVTVHPVDTSARNYIGPERRSSSAAQRSAGSA